MYVRTCMYKLRYTSQSCDAFRKRWNNYSCCTGKVKKGEECKQKYLHEHFLQDDHYGLLNDAQVTSVYKKQVSDHTKREYFCMRTLKTYYAYGFNEY